ncbi:MAG: hypothetical protein KDC13_06580, partial [Bacteroidetes bacterium]|nr:hypothetical protein [Bacteroidota bacterium]
MAFNKILIFTEAGKGIGFGHLTRCRSIGNAFVLAGFKCEYIIETKEFEPDNKQGEYSFSWHNELYLDKNPENCITLIDSYLADKTCIKKIADFYPYTAVIDDYNRIEYPVNLIINPGEDLNQIDYSNQKAEILKGVDYILLRPEVAAKAHEYHFFNDSINKILITVGGSDIHDILFPVGELVSKLLPESQVQILCPEAAKAELLSGNLLNCQILPRQNAEEMVSLFLQADLVISACGQTLHELAALGTPFIAFLTGDDQRYNQEFYFQNKIL